MWNRTVSMRARRGRGAAGEGKAGCIFWSLLLAAVIVAGVKIIPIEIAKSQLQDSVIEMVQFQRFKTQEFYQNAILRRAQELKLPIEKKHIKVSAGGQRIVVEIDTRVPVDLIVTTIQYRVRIYLDREIFIV